MLWSFIAEGFCQPRCQISRRQLIWVNSSIRQMGLLYCLTTTWMCQPARQIFYAMFSWGIHQWVSEAEVNWPAYLHLLPASQGVQLPLQVCHKWLSVCMRNVARGKHYRPTVSQSAHSTMKCLWYGLLAVRSILNAGIVGLCQLNFLPLEYCLLSMPVSKTVYTPVF